MASLMVSSIPALLSRYMEQHPEEGERLARLTRLVRDTVVPDALIARTNFAGHVTASGFVMTLDRSAVLLVYHRGLGMYVQPGGHVDPSDASLLDGARREVREETGLDGLQHVTAFADVAIPFDIDSHYIPPNLRKGEPEHWHHDFRYAFVCADATALTLAVDEVTQARWVSLEELDGYPTLEGMARKLTVHVSRP